MVLIVDMNKIQVFGKGKPVTPNLGQSDFVVLGMASASGIVLSSTGENHWSAPSISFYIESGKKLRDVCNMLRVIKLLNDRTLFKV